MAALHMIGPYEAPSVRPVQPVPPRMIRQGTSGTRAEAAASWWTAWGCLAQVAVTDRGSLRAARRLVERELADTERAAFRFRPDAEIHKLYRSGGRAITISPLLAELVSAALLTAERTGGDVDPTVAAAVTRIDAEVARDLQLVPDCARSARRPGRAARPAPGWESVHLVGRRLQVPPGVTLDLTATAKARSCDRAAFRVADRLGIGVSVALGGNVATAGEAPDGGWTVHLADRSGDRHGTVHLPAGTALATSDLIGMVDPRTGAPAADGDQARWRSASAIGFSCLEATSYTAAALVRGPSARGWLAGLGIPARLVTVDDDVIEVAGWADHARRSSPPENPSPETSSTDSQRTTLR